MLGLKSTGPFIIVLKEIVLQDAGAYTGYRWKSAKVESSGRRKQPGKKGGNKLPCCASFRSLRTICGHIFPTSSTLPQVLFCPSSRCLWCAFQRVYGFWTTIFKQLQQPWTRPARTRCGQSTSSSLWQLYLVLHVFCVLKHFEFSPFLPTRLLTLSSFSSGGFNPEQYEGASKIENLMGLARAQLHLVLVGVYLCMVCHSVAPFRASSLVFLCSCLCPHLLWN